MSLKYFLLLLVPVVNFAECELYMPAQHILEKQLRAAGLQKFVAETDLLEHIENTYFSKKGLQRAIQVAINTHESKLTKKHIRILRRVLLRPFRVEAERIKWLRIKHRTALCTRDDSWV